MGDAAGMLEILALLLAAVRAALRRRRDLVVENALLRHQLAVLTRPTRRRAELRGRDKLVWILARRFCHEWRRHPSWSDPGPSSRGTTGLAAFLVVPLAVPDRPT